MLLSNSAFFDICCFSCVIQLQSSLKDVLNCYVFTIINENDDDDDVSQWAVHLRDEHRLRRPLPDY